MCRGVRRWIGVWPLLDVGLLCGVVEVRRGHHFFLSVSFFSSPVHGAIAPHSYIQLHLFAFFWLMTLHHAGTATGTVA